MDDGKRHWVCVDLRCPLKFPDIDDLNEHIKVSGHRSYGDTLELRIASLERSNEKLREFALRKYREFTIEKERANHTEQLLKKLKLKAKNG